MNPDASTPVTLGIASVNGVGAPKVPAGDLSWLVVDGLDAPAQHLADAAKGDLPAHSTVSSKPTKVTASSTDFRFETTALAGKPSSGYPMATQIMIT